MPRDYNRVIETLDAIDELHKSQSDGGSKMFSDHIMWAYRDLASFTITVPVDEAVKVVERLTGHDYVSKVQVFQVSPDGTLRELVVSTRDSLEWSENLDHSSNVMLKINP